MVLAPWPIRISDDGQICLPEEFLRKFQLKAGDEVTVTYNNYQVIISPDDEARYAPPTQEELARLREVIDRTLAHRAQRPSMGSLTTTDLLRMSRDDNFWYGEEKSTEEAPANDSGED